MFNGSRLFASLLVFSVTVSITSPAPVIASEDIHAPAISAEEQILKLQIENESLNLKIRQIESIKSVSNERLRQKKAQRLKEIAADLKQQRQLTGDFEGFVKWMSANLAGYNRYIQAGSYAAVVAKMLPIPYAGQASIFTKFIAQFTVALNSASVSMTKYLDSSQKFISMAESIDTDKPLEDNTLKEAARFADQCLLKDMNDVQTKLATLSDLSSGALSFLESINHYVSGTDEYWNKVKGVFKKDIDMKEKSFISESTSGLKTQADRFNGRLRSFDDLGKKETAGVKALAVYDELAAEIAASGV